MPVCSHAPSTTMALSHSPHQAAVPLRCWANTMVSKHKQTAGIYLLFDLLPPIPSWEPLPCGCEVVEATATAPTVKLNFHTDQPEAPKELNPLSSTHYSTSLNLSREGSRKLPRPNIAQCSLTAHSVLIIHSWSGLHSSLSASRVLFCPSLLASYEWSWRVSSQIFSSCVRQVDFLGPKLGIHWGHSSKEVLTTRGPLFGEEGQRKKRECWFYSMVGLIKGREISLQDFQSAWPKGFIHHLSVQLNSLCSHTWVCKVMNSHICLLV